MVDHEELRKLAALAKLSLDGTDEETLIRDISEILEFAVAVEAAEADPADEAAMEPWPLREDNVEPSFDDESILKNAGEARDGYFVARKMGGPLSEQHQKDA